MLKKIFFIIIIVLIIAAGIAAYFFFFSTKQPGQGTDNGFSIQDLFPFGDDGTEPGNVDNNGEPIVEPPINEPTEPSTTPKLVMVAKGPVSGSYVYDVLRELPRDPEAKGLDGKPLPIQTEPATMVRYVETATGHTNETYLDRIELKKLTNTTIPKIAEAFFGGKGGSSAILRYAEDNNTIQTFTGNIPLLPNKDGSPDTNLRGTFLAEDTTAMAVSPDREKIFSIVKSDSGSTGTISLPDGSRKNQLFSLAFSEWATEWPSTKFVTITTKPSSKVSGYSYTIDTTTKAMKKVIGGVFGLTTLTSPDMKTILFSRSAGSSVTSSLYNTQAKSVLPLPGATTLPEKCVWQNATILYCAVPSFMPNAEYPDAWYQGSISFVDQIYKIDTNTFSSAVLVNPATFGTSIDAINLSVDPSNTYLIFTNKKDGSLWSLDLKAN